MRQQESAVIRAARLLKRMVGVAKGNDLFRFRNVKIPSVHLGTLGADWVVNLELLDASSVVYSFGVGQDISFDRALIERKDVTVHAFDPTPRSLDWLKTQSLPKQFHIHEYGLAGFDGELTFFPPTNPNFTSYSSSQENHVTSEPVHLPVKTLTTIMADLGHQQVDLLKMDIEGSEYDAVPQFLAKGIEPRQLLIEFHHRFKSFGARKTSDCIQLIRSHGYKTFSVSPTGQEFSFIKP